MSDKSISERKVKKDLSFTGGILILYALLVLFLPHAFLYVMKRMQDTVFLESDILFFGIYYIFILVGTLVPFLILQKHFSISFKLISAKIDASFFDLFTQTIVFFAIVTVAVFISNIIGGYLGLEATLLSNIGNLLRAEYVGSPLFIFLYIIACPILEEFAFRGVLLNGLRRFGRLFALIASSTVFALAHTSFADMLTAFLMAYLLGKVFLRYHSIQPTIVIHILFNLFVYTLCIVPNGAAKYMNYLLILMYLFSVIYLVIHHSVTGIRIRNSVSSSEAMRLFFTRVTVIIAILLFIGHSVLLLLFP